MILCKSSTYADYTECPLCDLHTFHTPCSTICRWHANYRLTAIIWSISLSTLHSPQIVHYCMIHDLQSLCIVSYQTTTHSHHSHTAELVANRFLEEVELTDVERSASITICKHFHQSVRELSVRFAKQLGRHNYVTPTSYLELISSFKSLLASKRGEVLKSKKRYEVGLEKLAFAASQVSWTFVKAACMTFIYTCSGYVYHTHNHMCL